VGAVERKGMLTGQSIQPGDTLVGLASSGLHTNGYSLARKLLFEVARRKLDRALADELLKVHRSYLKPIQELLAARCLKGAAHITGGGIPDNLPRILPKGLAARILPGSWLVPPIFEELRTIGNIPIEDYHRTFNLGIGMILVVPRRKLNMTFSILDRLGEQWFLIGRVIESKIHRVLYA
jgi:phosphoribosylformylglycinamidine cyclo-ligase